MYGLEDLHKITTQSTKGSNSKRLEQDKRTKDGTKQEETKGEKSKLPANLDEDTTDDQEDNDSQEDGEYVEELSEDKKKYIDTT